MFEILQTHTVDFLVFASWSVTPVVRLQYYDLDVTLEQERREKKARKSKDNYQRLLAVEDQNLIPNTEEFECPICFDTIGVQEGVILRECLHSFCKECLKGAVQHNDEANIRCPYQDDIYSCQASLQDREVKSLVPPEIFEKYLQRSLTTAESQERNSFHCKTTDCQGWCIYEDAINFFECPICGKKNCLTCKAIHEGMNCKQYQEDIKLRAANDAAARQTQLMLTEMVKKGDAMNCPQCDVILQKKDGCDWIKCSICKTEICWVTKGRRWGPLVR
ncbi:hypothetical protein FSP39_006577 [Pinctada imbricata]|uniref:RanBP-type and C3HC4-type zinc finger-containing protein 1 n=1 Tax=Pinctada imbricata TaxID=66713 RepID=A0AA88XHX0_PINIB|nr:hypothetical protein FSP39_006577 [Pinctada imbricata]